MRKAILFVAIILFNLFQSFQLHAQSWQPSSPNIYFNGGNVGIGTTTPGSMLDIVTGIGDGSTNEANCLRLRHTSTAGNSQCLQMGVNNTGVGGNNNGYGYISSVYWGSNENNPLLLNPKGGPVGFGLTSGVNWNATAKDAVAIRASGPTANNTLMGKLVFAHFGNYSANSSFIAGVYDKSAFSSGAGMVFHTVSGSDISGVDGIERMRISSDGNVGIGTSNPTEKLSIQAATGNAINMALRNQDGTPLLSLAADGSANSSISSYYGLTFNSTYTPFYSFKIAGTEYFKIDGSGKVGIGNVLSPQAPLHISGGLPALTGGSVICDKGGAANQFYFSFYGDNLQQAFIGQPSNVARRLDLGTGNSDIALTILDGNVGIGTTSPQAKLAVNGDIVSKKVRVTPTGWADYVFNTGYRLRSLAEVEEYVKQHHHLPEVPSAKEVEKDGLDVGDNQATLLKKIEELTLYMIEQNKKILSLESKVKSLEEKGK